MGTTYSIIERIKVKYEVSLRAGGHLRRFRRRKPRALSYYSELTLSQSFQPMAARLSKKAALPLAKILATASCHNSKTGPRVEFAWLNAEWTYGDQDNSSETIMPKYFASRTLSRICRQMIRHIFELESSNLWQICILVYSQLVLKIGVIDCDLQGHFGHFDLEF